jgi:curved DNA-binding protein CbpA
VKDEPFVDHYEILQLSQGADQETLERVFRLLAKRYHPDNPESGNEASFREVHEAYEILTDPTRRAAYDVQYDKHKSMQWQVFDQDTTRGGHEEDQRIFSGVLALLYAARRRNPESGGVGSIDLERKLGVPREHLEFPFWYMKKRGWIEILQSGQYAITIDGIDEVLTRGTTAPVTRMLTDGGANGEPRPADGPRSASEPNSEVA